MYREFYSLLKAPFSKEIKTPEVFSSAAFTELSLRLEYLKKARGIGLVTGDAGAGKTLTIRTFCESLNPSLYKVIYFPLSTLTVSDFYRGLRMALGEEPRFRKVDLFYQIQKSIIASYKERKITPVFILDELQMARDAFILDLSILFNFSMDSENPFILALSGLPYLLNKLLLNQHRPLNQRIVMRYKLEPMNIQEVSGYIRHHMSIAGAKHEIFNEKALNAIAAVSKGWPRLVNLVAMNCLLYGYQAKKELIDEEVVRIAAEESGL